MQRDDHSDRKLLANGNGTNGASHSSAMLPVEPRFVIEQGPPAPQPSDNSFVLRAILAALRRRWLLATTLGLACGTIGATLAWFLIPAPYTAFAEVRIHSLQPRLLFNTDDRARFDVYKQTHMRMLKSYFVLQNALRAPISDLSLIRNEPHPVDWLEANLQVTSPAQEFIRVSLSGENPSDLAAVVDAVVAAYQRDVVDHEERVRRERLTELEKIHSGVQQEVDLLRDDYRRQAANMKVPNTQMGEQKQQFMLDRYLGLQEQYRNVEFELFKIQAQLAVVERLGQGQTTDDVEIAEPMLEAQLLQMPEYQRVASRLAQYEEFFAQTSRRITPGHASLRPYEQELEKLREERDRKRAELLPTAHELVTHSMVVGGSDGGAAALKQRIESHTLNLQTIEEAMKEVEAKEGSFGLSNLALEEITKKMEYKEGVAKALSDQIEKLRIELNSPIGVNTDMKARIPHERNMKKRIMGTGGAGLGMFALIVGGIVLLEVRSRRISSVDQVAGGLNVRILGSVPAMPRSVTAARSEKRKARNAFWNSVLGESIDATRTMLLREAREHGRNVVMIASAMGGEGKTTLCCHLATSLSRARRRVLLVDCDLRRPTVNRVFGLPQGPGLCEVLRGEAKLEDVIHLLKNGLSVLPAGKVSQEVLQTLARDGVEPVFKELREQFDFLVIDSSPVLPITDSLLIAQHVDGIVFAIRRDVSRAAKVAAAMQRMEMLGVPLLGAVVIGLDDASGESSYGYRYGYGYGYGSRNAYHSASLTR